MRIAYVCMDPGIPVFGTKGASVHVQEWIRAASRGGARVELFAARLDGEAPRDLREIPVHILPVEKGRGVAQRERALQRADLALERALRRAGPFDLVYTRHALFCRAAMRVARECGWPGIEEVNAPLVEEQRRHRHLDDEATARVRRCESFGAAGTLVAVSDALAAQIAPEALSTPIAVVPNGVDTDRFHPAVEASWRRPPGAFVVGFAGSLKPWHGLAGLFDAFSRFQERDPRAHLLIVGDGPERERLERRAGSFPRGKDGVSFAGARKHGDIPGLLASMDVAVAPYPAVGDPASFYFSPLKVLEYMAAGRPVVASRIGQIETWVQSGVDGLLVAPGDAPALARALERIAREPAFAAELGRCAHKSALSWSWARRVEETLALARALPASGAQ